MALSKNQKIGLAVVLLATVIGAIPTVLLLKYDIKSLPVLGSDLNLGVKSLKPRIPYSHSIGPDDVLKTETISEMGEAEKQLINSGLWLAFKISVDNFAYYFPYFSTIEITEDQGTTFFSAVFSKYPPEIIQGLNVRTVQFGGQRILIDVIRGQIVYSEGDGSVHVGKGGTLTTKTYYSKTLEVKESEKPEPKPKTQEPKGERL